MTTETNRYCILCGRKTIFGQDADTAVIGEVCIRCMKPPLNCDCAPRAEEKEKQ